MATVAALLAGFGLERVMSTSSSAAEDLLLPGALTQAGPPTAVAAAFGALARRPAATTPAGRPVPEPRSARAGASPPPPAMPAPMAGGSPFAGAKLYVDPHNAAAVAVTQLRSSAPAKAAVLTRLADTSHADWFGDAAATDIQARVTGRVSEIRAAGALPVLVAYAIPNRDCGGYSGGGAGSPAAYRSWISSFAAGIGHGPAVVILEPDALSQTECLSEADRQTRYALLSGAVDVLDSAGATVYLDAGNAGWHTAADMATVLRAAGVDRARGFALNVSNFDETPDELTFGNAISAALGGTAHFVIDTSRNGLGPAPGNVWCNPPGRALGARPTAATAAPLADAYLWIKIPGESDGTCNGGPAAGQWWLDYAIGLASRAAA